MTKILSVDDDATIRQMIVDILETQDHEVISAEDGRAGIEMAKAQMPDLIICDVEMPDMNGWSMLEAIRENPDLQDIPFIFLTGLNSMQNLRQGMNLGADDYLTKPFTFDELIEAVKVRLDKHQALTIKHKAELKQADQKITQALYFDSVTALPNRKLMQEHFLSTANAANGQNIAVFSIMLDHFDKTLAWRPQALSNFVLKEMAQRLKKIFTADESLVYIDHNHFLGFYPTDADRVQIQSCLQKIQNALANPFLIMQNSFNLTASIGIAIYPLDAHELGEIVQEATNACQKAQQQGGSQYCYHG